MFTRVRRCAEPYEPIHRDTEWVEEGRVRQTTMVYVSGPLTTGGPVALSRNIRRAVEAGCALIERGYIAVVPHEKALLCEEIFRQSYAAWLEYDFRVIERCDAVLRLPGVSPGADREAAHARALGLPVYFSLDTLCACEPVGRAAAKEVA